MSRVTWNPNDRNTNIALSDGNLKITVSTNVSLVRATDAKVAGKWYWEIVQERTSNNNIMLGISTKEHGLSTWQDSNYYVRHYSGENQPVGTTWGMSLDFDNERFTVFKNGVQAGSYKLTSYMMQNPVYATVGLTTRTGTNIMKTNFGATPFKYDIPEGHYPYDYYIEGHWESDTIDLGIGWQQTNAINVLSEILHKTKIEIEISTSNDGISFSNYASLDESNPPQARYLKIKATLSAQGQYEENQVFIFNQLEEQVKVILNEFTEADGQLKLKMDYEYDMNKDNSWTEEGSVHRKLVRRSDWKKIDSIGVG